MNTSPRHCRRRLLRRILLSCLVAGSTVSATPAIAGSWDCGSDIVPVTEPLPEEAVAPAAASGEKAGTTTCSQPGMCEVVPAEEVAEPASRTAADETETGARRADALVSFSLPANPPLASRRTSFSFASALERISGATLSLAGRSPLARRAAADPGVDAQITGIRSGSEEQAAAEQQPEAERIDPEVAFLRRQLASLAEDDRAEADGVGTETLAGPVEPVADAETLEELAEVIRGVGHRGGSEVALETCLGSCFVVEIDPAVAPPRLPAEEATQENALSQKTAAEMFLQRQLAMLDADEPLDASSLADPVDPVAEPGALAHLIAQDSPSAAVDSRERAARREAGAAGGAGGAAEVESKPAARRAGASAVVATLEEAYLPYDLTPQDRQAAARYSLDGQPFCLRDCRSQASESSEQPETAPVPAESSPRQAAEVVMRGSPYCLLDELVWRSERALADGAPLRQALTPSEVGRRLAAVAYRGDRAVAATAEAVAAAWPAGRGTEASRAGQRLLARAGATEQAGRRAEEAGSDAGAGEAGATEAILASLELKTASGEAVGAPPAAAKSVAEADATVGAEPSGDRAQWASAAAQLRSWVSQAQRWSRQLWEVARRPASDRQVR